MLLTITTTHHPATDLGYLLHKNPARAQSFEQSFGRAHVFYPEVTEDRCTAALLLDIDPVALVRGRRPDGGGGALDQYVNDRPYVASSFLSVAISEIFGSEPLIAYVSGDTPPDVAAIAAFGIDVVCLDNRAPWYNESLLVKAREHGLHPVAFAMGYVAGHGSTYRIAGTTYGSPNGQSG